MNDLDVLRDSSSKPLMSYRSNILVCISVELVDNNINFILWLVFTISFVRPGVVSSWQQIEWDVISSFIQVIQIYLWKIGRKIHTLLSISSIDHFVTTQKNLNCESCCLSLLEIEGHIFVHKTVISSQFIYTECDFCGIFLVPFLPKKKLEINFWQKSYHTRTFKCFSPEIIGCFLESYWWKTN